MSINRNAIVTLEFVADVAPQFHLAQLLLHECRRVLPQCLERFPSIFVLLKPRPPNTNQVLSGTVVRLSDADQRLHFEFILVKGTLENFLEVRRDVEF